MGDRIIYGISETKHLPTNLDGGVDPAQITPEWLEQVINSRIQPRIDGITIQQVPLTTGRAAYVLDVPQSLRAPHMASDHRYYRRFNFQSVMMDVSADPVLTRQGLRQD